MTDQGVEQKPSATAFYAALRRSLANKKYGDEKFGPDYLADLFLPPHFRFFLKFKSIIKNTTLELDEVLPGLNDYMIARTVYFDKLFREALKSEVPQIVLMGAGYDTRAYRFAEFNQATRIFELDIAPTQEKKMKCLRKGRVDIPEQVIFVPINFNRDSMADVLRNAGFDEERKTLFIWEGVTYYLESESVDATLEFVSSCSHPETAIAFDYTVSLSEDNIKDYFGVEAFVKTMKEEHGDEELMFSIGDSEIELFLSARGLKLVEHLDNDEIEKAFLIKEDGELTGQMTGHFRFVLASR